METFKIENIKIPPIKLVPELNKETGILKLRTEVMGIIYEEIAELNSKAIRESLIEMGWTTPEDTEIINNYFQKIRNAFSGQRDSTYMLELLNAMLDDVTKIPLWDEL